MNDETNKKIGSEFFLKNPEWNRLDREYKWQQEKLEKKRIKVLKKWELKMSLQREKSAKNIKRATEFLEMKNKGMTLNEIGYVTKLTRERVRQILNGYFPNQVINVGSYRKEHREYIEFICDQCKKKYSEYEKAKIENKNKTEHQFCGIDCFQTYRNTHKFYHTEQERLEYYRKRGRRYYNEVLKKRPNFHSMIRKWNNNYYHSEAYQVRRIEIRNPKIIKAYKTKKYKDIKALAGKIGRA